MSNTALVEVLLQVPALADANVRDAVVDETTAVLRRKFTPRRTPQPHADLVALVDSYGSLTGGLIAFTRIVAQRHPGAEATRAAELARELQGQLLLSDADRHELCRVLGEAGTQSVFGALGDLSDLPELRDVRIWFDWAAVVQVMERQPTPAGGVPPLLGFVVRLAALIRADLGGALRRWAADISGGVGVPGAALTALQLDSRDDEQSPTRRRAGVRVIRSRVPIRNYNFTGREELLERLATTLASGSKAAVLPQAVLPQAVHGMGGVGKTQLVVEYIHQHLEDYDLVWWVPADSVSGVLASLEQLAEQLEIRPGENWEQTARLVLDTLASVRLRWLLVFDNANDLDSIGDYVPSTGGDVVVTTRNREWADVGTSIEVEVFKRFESINLLRGRTKNSIGTADADRLADRLGDLPLALEQAAAWHLATKMPVSQYLDLLDKHRKELLSEGKPAGYSDSVVAFVTLATAKLRTENPATAQLLELFAFLGGEPVPVSLLRYGKDADVVQPLRSLLGDTIKINLAVRDLSQYGLVKVDDAQRLQVHRLVQDVLRDTLDPVHADELRRSIQNLLAKAGPGDPDENTEPAEVERQREVGPHLERAGMIEADRLEAKQAVLHHIRFLYNTGDYENSRRIAKDAVECWRENRDDPRLGPDGELTLQARSHITNASRALGESASSDEETNQTYELMRRYLGEEAKSTLVLGNQVGQAIRIRGEYAESLAFAKSSLERHRRAFNSPEPYVLRAQSNLAVAYRMVGEFAEAAKLDQAIVDYWETKSPQVTSFSALEAYMNIARDYYGLGAYRAGLAVLEGWRGVLMDRRSRGHRIVVLSGRTHGITLRKAGQLPEAVDVLSENLDETLNRFGLYHEYTVAALCSKGNALRQLGDTAGALDDITEAVVRYRKYFGQEHPLTLVALVNEAIARRAAGDVETAGTLDEQAYDSLTQALGPNHPYTLCAGTSLATDHALRGDHDEALALSSEMLERSRITSGGPHEVRGDADHPYHLARAINYAHDLRATGDTEQAETLLVDSIAGLRQSLGETHPEVLAAERGERLEGDIEAPPT
ncbi:FxSxx-COOH system tetratricopeptide repeat protein [Actinoplanes regularis]|uniref:FxSxx-COOH system tetratricopeptide repeat protein n=1 Tax=Actinoplanes regularis TaxID=52697 RepID=UPI0024A028CD|nr:FxSxx-COOH system tetratricopeptide repeat protein [Actinoplanes regularis]GLW28312.1 cytochrome c [Actinoplanes regularis]